MGHLSLVGLALGMSMDAFAVALAKGATMQHPSLLTSAKIGFLFGLTEGLATLLGYLFGVLAEDWVRFWDHWLSFVLLGFLGVQMIYGAIKHVKKPTTSTPKPQTPATPKNTMLMLMTAFATSVDALIIGVTLAFLQVNIYLACILIALATMLMVTLGVYFGYHLGAKIGKWAEGLGGVVLIGIGTSILWTHLVGA